MGIVALRDQPKVHSTHSLTLDFFDSLLACVYGTQLTFSSLHSPSPHTSHTLPQTDPVGSSGGPPHPPPPHTHTRTHARTHTHHGAARYQRAVNARSSARGWLLTCRVLATFTSMTLSPCTPPIAVAITPPTALRCGIPAPARSNRYSHR